MKVSYIYVPLIKNAQPVTARTFVNIMRQIEALRYLQGLRFNKNVSELFAGAIKDAIEASIPSFISEANLLDFYGNLEVNILADIGATLETSVEYDDLATIQWYKIIISIPTEETDVQRMSTTTMAVDNPTEECRRLLTDLEPKK